MSMRKANGMVTEAVVVDHLTKHFGEVLAVTDISFEIQEGEIFGILEPNGAGRSCFRIKGLTKSNTKT